jgi:hypothetical protein
VLPNREVKHKYLNATNQSADQSDKLEPPPAVELERSGNQGFFDYVGSLRGQFHRFHQFGSHPALAQVASNTPLKASSPRICFQCMGIA